MTYRIIDLFSGAGGMTLGFVDERFGGGFESVWAIDNDRAAIETYEANFGNHALCDDIEKWASGDADIPQADIVIGGPPCQGFSLLNKKREGDARRELWRPFLDIVEKSGARVFVIENVQGLLRSEELTHICERADALGFDVRYDHLLAADYGSPQTRKRAVIIGWKRSSYSAPTFPPLPTHASPKRHSNLPRWRTVHDAIGNLPEPVGTEIRKIRSPYNLHFGRNPTELSKKRYRLVPEGGNRFDLQKAAPELTPQCWIRKTSGGTDLFGRLWWDRPSVTIRTEFFKPEKGRYLHPVSHRPITHREAARLMGFPDNFIFKGSKTEIARQIGNAVPPHLGGAISRVVKEILEQGRSRKAA
ncbi:MAG: DNA cytosine methyltransferase [Hyphomicrobiaceae bacterium]|nr:DNA cytosine methyltransferase [Hyphomicrobiaceae bacterium]